MTVRIQIAGRRTSDKPPAAPPMRLPMLADARTALDHLTAINAAVRRHASAMDYQAGFHETLDQMVAHSIVRVRDAKRRGALR